MSSGALLLPFELACSHIDSAHEHPGGFIRSGYVSGSTILKAAGSKRFRVLACDTTAFERDEVDVSRCRIIGRRNPIRGTQGSGAYFCSFETWLNAWDADRSAFRRKAARPIQFAG